ncbi:MAG: hypothetical protein Q4C89_05650 [Deinococcus sp.]|uniref:hypothetical protein n=1 Tax=Deinococcus sp. TaxID=47478 RepID=UPI0026DA91B9|nr:hypothetical protein [Deinococcus sp.]MDO4245486.1 hypothetical protein [Deinococcus sp.]
MSSLRYVLALGGALAVTARAADPPTIVQIRANYAAVNASIGAQKYKKQSGEVAGCGDFYRVYTRWLDSRGTIRRLDEKVYGDSVSAGSEFFSSFWFDAAGRLDFALYQQTRYDYKIVPDKNGVNQPVLKNGQPVVAKVRPEVELRAYFDDQGRVLRLLNNYPLGAQETAEVVRMLRHTAATPWKSLLNPRGC